MSVALTSKIPCVPLPEGAVVRSARRVEVTQTEQAQTAGGLVVLEHLLDSHLGAAVGVHRPPREIL